MKLRNSQQKGFTLIEMIVSLGVFSVVITIAVGALLSLIATNQQLQQEQSVMTNLSFTLDSMMREIRTGTYYYCETSNNPTRNSTIFADGEDLDVYIEDLSNGVDRNCSDGHGTSPYKYHGLAFRETGDSISGDDDMILYYFDATEEKIFRRTGSNAAQSIVSQGIEIVDAQFFVSGSAKHSEGDFSQPVVTLVIEAKDAASPKRYYLQTTVTQRTLDI
jgi:prepilin-type N-terminal cleavage/methylation domain-containing protein